MSGYRERLAEAPPATRRCPLPVRLLHRGFEWFCTMLFRLYCPLSTSGRERLPPPPFILCSNHASHADSPALMHASGMGFDQFALIAADDYFFKSKTPLKHLPQLLLNLVPAERRAGRDRILRMLQACREYQQDRPRCLILYPEGTREGDGQIGEIKRGAALLAVQLGLPIVPAYIHGTYYCMPKGQWYPRAAPIHVCFGTAIAPPKPPQRGAGRVYAKLTDELEYALHALRDQHLAAT